MLSRLVQPNPYPINSQLSTSTPIFVDSHLYQPPLSRTATSTRATLDIIMPQEYGTILWDANGVRKLLINPQNHVARRPFSRGPYSIDTNHPLSNRISVLQRSGSSLGPCSLLSDILSELSSWTYLV
jgi:hypothetical protein